MKQRRSSSCLGDAVERPVRSRRASGWRAVALGGLLLLTGVRVFAAGLEVAFDAANKLFEEGKYAEAAAGYEKLLSEGHRAASVYYNLGTAYYKAGQMGRAVYAFRRAEQLTPRDANLRANLQFVRKKINGEEKSPVPFWQSWLGLMTLNEGTTLAAVACWIWFLCLAAREWKPSLKPVLRGYTLTAGLLAALLTGLLATSAYVRLGEVSGVVIVKEAVVRFGPIEESQTSHQLPDGTEVKVLDAKDNWVLVRDLARRVGWVKRDQLAILGGAKSAPKSP
jgi:tetratricopeptide (TPR) repeat protein